MTDAQFHRGIQEYHDRIVKERGMRIYGVDPEVTPVTFVVDCPVCGHENGGRVRMLLGETAETYCHNCRQPFQVRWVFDEPLTNHTECERRNDDETTRTV